jgi:hypothetical protein
MSDIDFSILLHSVFGADGYEVSGFGELIHDHPNRIKVVDSQWQTHDKVHANGIHFQTGILKDYSSSPDFI